MQASKIDLRTVYAIKRQDGTLARFYVTGVVTRRKRDTGGPHDYESWVEGYDQDDGETENKVEKTVDPKQILGPFEEQVELKARADAEKAARKAEEDRKRDLQQELRRHLYAAAGIALPNDDSEKWKQPIRANSGYDLDVRWEAVEALVKYFRAKGEDR